MSRRNSRHGRERARPDAGQLSTFLLQLGRTGSVTAAADHVGLARPTLYKLKANDEQFALQWAEALELGVDRLQDDAMRRALDGTERPIIQGGRQVGSVRQYDNRLLQFLLKAHRPEIYGDRQGMAPALPFDLVKRIKAAEPRAAAHRQSKKDKEASHVER
jgi:hypothetical protein